MGYKPSARLAFSSLRSTLHSYSLSTGEGWGEGRAYRPEGSSPFSCSQVMACSRSWTVW